MLIHHLLDITVITVIGHSDSLEVQVHSHNRGAEAEADLSRMQTLSFVNQQPTDLISEDAQGWGIFHWHLKLAEDRSILAVEGCCCMTNSLLKATRQEANSKIPRAIQECRGRVATLQELAGWWCIGADLFGLVDSPSKPPWGAMRGVTSTSNSLNARCALADKLSK